jgi:hypothetical protein
MVKEAEVNKQVKYSSLLPAIRVIRIFVIKLKMLPMIIMAISSQMTPLLTQMPNKMGCWDPGFRGTFLKIIKLSNILGDYLKRIYLTFFLI